MRVIRIAQAQRLRRDRPSSYVVLKGEPPLGQPLYIYPGVPLIACVQATKDSIHNSMLLEIQSYTNETITLKDCEGDGVYTLSHEWVRKNARSGLCFTIASAQGRTIWGDIGIWDSGHPKFTLRHLYTCLFRSTAFILLSLE